LPSSEEGRGGKEEELEGSSHKTNYFRFSCEGEELNSPEATAGKILHI
jgi:hypothetical protein